MKKLLYISLIFNVLAFAAGGFALHRFGGWKNLKYKILNRGVSRVYDHRKTVLDAMPTKDSSIIFLGNSITEQCDWAELLGQPNILNRGIAGDHCDGMRGRLDEVLRHRPSKLFLMAGVNDLAYHTPAVVLPKYERLVEAILAKSPATTLYLQSVLPVNNTVSHTPVDNADVLALNEEIKRLANAKGLIYIDLHEVLNDLEGNLDAAYTQDGIHLNGAAYSKWAAEIRPFLQ